MPIHLIHSPTHPLHTCVLSFLTKAIPTRFTDLLDGERSAVLCFYMSSCPANVAAVREISAMSSTDPYKEGAAFFVCSLENLEVGSDPRAGGWCVGG